MLPKIDTFEADIASEIKRKEASFAQVQASMPSGPGSRDDDKSVVLPKRTPLFFIGLVVFAVITVIAVGVLIHLLVTSSTAPQQITETPQTVKTQQEPSTLTALSPTLSYQIGRYVGSVEKKEVGYIITLKEYSPVFAYVTRNEGDYIEDLANLFGDIQPSATTTKKEASQQPESTSSTSLPQTATIATIASSTGSTATGTQATSTKKLAQATPKTATTTKQKTQEATTTEPSLPLPPPVALPRVTTEFITPFSDLTISNQNMRVYTKDTKKVIYAFVGTKYLLIAQTPEAILSLRSGILK